MGSGLDNWIYWHFFTITINYNSSQSVTVQDSLHSGWTSVFPSAATNDERLITAHILKSLPNESIEFTNDLSFITSGEPTRGHHTEQSVFWSLVSVTAETSVQFPTKRTSVSAVILTFRRCLPNRCLANGDIRHSV
jgi:hypothetical protein